MIYSFRGFIRSWSLQTGWRRNCRGELEQHSTFLIKDAWLACCLLHFLTLEVWSLFVLTMPGYNPSAQILAAKAVSYPVGIVCGSLHLPHPGEESSFIYTLQNTWSFQQTSQQKKPDTETAGTLPQASLVHSCLPSEYSWLLHPPRKTCMFPPAPEWSVCHHKHNSANDYSLKLGAFHQDLSINIHSQSVSTKVKCQGERGLMFFTASH